MRREIGAIAVKLQFAFGNPRRKKSKRVAKRRKKTKTNSVKAKSKKAGRVAKSKRRKRSFGKRRKNPEASIIRKNGKTIGREFSPLNKRESMAAEGKAKGLIAKYKSAPLGAQKNAYMKELVKLKNQLGKRSKYVKTIERYLEDGASVSSFDLAKKGEGKMAKRRKKKKSGSKKTRKTKKKAAKKAVKAKTKRTKRKSGKRRSTKRRSRKAKKVVVHATPKRAKRRKSKSKRKGGKRRRRARMITHKHASSTRHIKKGTSFRFKTKSKKGKRSITVSGRVKVNPYRRNPMKQLSAQSKKYLGIEASELTALAVGGLSVPIINSLAGKYIPTVVTKINSFVGPQAVGSVLPIIGGVILNAIAEHGVKSGKGHDALKMAGEGLAAAGIIGLAMGISQKYVTPALGLSGVIYTPSMRGMGIVPQLGGVNYTPTMRGLGDVRYTPNMRGADFGSANYGGNGGSREAVTQRSDFGADFSSDSEGLLDQEDPDNAYSQSMN